ncbi:hypothetical protein MBLNU457_2259t1 [Dothideomycetes sp. NU457]
MTSPMSLLAPMRRLLVPRPAILAWRNARYYATEMNESTISQPPPMPLDQSSSGMTERTITPPVPSSEPGIDTAITSLDQDGTSLAVTGDESALVPMPKPEKRIVGIVVDAGKMDKTVKNFNSNTNKLVHDPANSIRKGDVISLRPHYASKHARHIVHEIISPFGEPISARPPLLTEEQMQAIVDAKRAAKAERRSLRAKAGQGDPEAIEELKRRGIATGQNVAPGKKPSKKEKKKGLVGAMGQMLPEGVLPGGLHAVGDIDARAKRNKEMAMKRNQRAEENLREAREM